MPKTMDKFNRNDDSLAITNVNSSTNTHTDDGVPSKQSTTKPDGSITSTTATTTTSTTKGGSSMPISLILANIGCIFISVVVVHSFWELLGNDSTVEEALAFYGLYHRYGWNQVIHFIGVPGIVWSLLIFTVQVPLPLFSSYLLTSSFTYGSFIAICYSFCYILIDPLGGILYSPVLYGMYVSAKRMVHNDQQQYYKNRNNSNNNNETTTIPWYGTTKPIQLAVAVNILCWYLQIHIGHTLIEGAKPAILESVGGAISVAPLFAFYEGLWMVGVNTQLQASTQALVDVYTQEICTASVNTAMKVCTTLQ